MKRISMGALSLLALLVTFGLLRNPQPAHAQEEEKPGSIYVETSPANANDETTGKRVVMVSIIREGKVIQQRETFGANSLSGMYFNDLRSGTYDVRLEGDGVITSVKKGIVVNSEQGTALKFRVAPGEGVRTVEYATGGLSREEIAARLAKLEAAVEELKKK